MPITLEDIRAASGGGSCFTKGGPVNDLIDLESLLVHAMRCKAVQRFFAQVVWGIGKLFEEVALRRRDGVGLMDQIDASIDGLKASPTVVYLQLCLYIESCKVAVGVPPDVARHR